MKRFSNLKKVLYKFLHPGAAVVLLSIPVCGGLLAYVFLVAGEDSPLAYLTYPLAAYALTIVCVNGAALVRSVARRDMEVPLVRRFMQDVAFRTRVTLYASLLINLLYAAMNGFSGLYYRSAWFGTLAAYYLFLAVMRFSLVRYAHKTGIGTDPRGEYRRYRMCGALLVFMNIALAGVVVLVLQQDGGFSYAGFLVYAMAAYAFYVTIMGIVNLVRYRKYHSPVLSASRAVCLAAALVSMLSLEVAMLEQFGGQEDALFRTVMVGTTGFAVCATVVGMGSFMIVHATKALKGETRGGPETETPRADRHPAS